MIKQYTKFTITDGKISHENVKSTPNGIGIWTNDDGTIDLYYETYEDKYDIARMVRTIRRLYKHDFKYTCIDWHDDQPWDIYEYDVRPNEPLPQFNHIVHDEYIDTFSVVIVGNCDDDINFQKTTH